MFLPSVWLVVSFLSIILIPMDWILWIASFPFKPWRLLLVCTTVINLWNAIVFSYLPESPKFLIAKNRKEEAFNVLRRMYAFNTGESKDVSWDCFFFLFVYSKRFCCFCVRFLFVFHAFLSLSHFFVLYANFFSMPFRVLRYLAIFVKQNKRLSYAYNELFYIFSSPNAVLVVPCYRNRT